MNCSHAAEPTEAHALQNGDANHSGHTAQRQLYNGCDVHLHESWLVMIGLIRVISEDLKLV